MTFKIEIGNKDGRTYHFELKDEAKKESLIGKKIGGIIQGIDIDKVFSGYEFQITGLSDKQGFPARQDIKGQGIKKVLLTYGVGMKRIKKGKKKRKLPKGLRLRKSIHANIVDGNIAQINAKVIKQGSKALDEILGKKEEKKKKEGEKVKVEKKEVKEQIKKEENKEVEEQNKESQKSE